jgi:hypothetical protein
VGEGVGSNIHPCKIIKPVTTPKSLYVPGWLIQSRPLGGPCSTGDPANEMRRRRWRKDIASSDPIHSRSPTKMKRSELIFYVNKIRNHLIINFSPTDVPVTRHNTRFPKNLIEYKLGNNILFYMFISFQ